MTRTKPTERPTRSRWLGRAGLACGLAVAAAHPALAQSTGDNAVASAEDAFGTSTSHETIGVYDESNVRGFSPGNAGNFRMEGMYFDIQGALGNRVTDGETIRVGPAAQGYAFPAPTGIVDLTLKKADDKSVIAPFASIDSFGSVGLELDTQHPLAGKALTLASGVGVNDTHYSDGGGSNQFNIGLARAGAPIATSRCWPSSITSSSTTTPRRGCSSPPATSRLTESIGAATSAPNSRAATAIPTPSARSATC
jgi:hypothetical protein